MKSHLLFKIAFAFSIVILFSSGNVSASGKLKVACVGNSITYGYGLSYPSTQSYPSQMLLLLDSTKWAVGNFGVSSRTMLKKGNLPYWNEAAYTNAKAFLPNYVMIELGTNDAKTTNWNPYGSEFVGNYKEMIQVFQNLSSKPEVWIGLLPPGKHVSWTILPNYIQDSVNVRIKQIAIESGVGLIDLFDAFNGNSANWYNAILFQSDSIHPKTAGAAVIAQKVKEMITLAKPQLKYTGGKIVAPTANAYQWYLNGGMIPAANGGNGQEFVPTSTGKYKVSLKLNATNETRIVSGEIEITSLSSGLPENKSREMPSIYPNPTTTGFVTLEMPETSSGKNELVVYDITGKVMLNHPLALAKETLNMNNLPNGMYLFQVRGDASSYTSGIIKSVM